MRLGFILLVNFSAASAIMSPAFAQMPVTPSAVTPVSATVDLDRALQCMSLAIGYEAGFESSEGQQAVAEVILNRTRHSAYPKSVCGVVFQGSARRTGCQFTFTCDGAMKRDLPIRVMQNSRNIAQSVLTANFIPQVNGATHYHANYVSPYWAPSLIRVRQIGAHIFYRAPGSADQPARYKSIAEPTIAGLGNWAMAPDTLTQRHKDQPVQLAPKAVEVPIFAPWGLAPAR